MGLPEELTIGSQKMTKIFGFPDRLLGEHIEYAFHALALNETRADFVSVRTSPNVTAADCSGRIVPNSNRPKAEEARSKF